MRAPLLLTALVTLSLTGCASTSHTHPPTDHRGPSVDTEPLPLKSALLSVAEALDALRMNAQSAAKNGVKRELVASDVTVVFRVAGTTVSKDTRGGEAKLDLVVLPVEFGASGSSERSSTGELENTITVKFANPDLLALSAAVAAKDQDLVQQILEKLVEILIVPNSP